MLRQQHADGDYVVQVTPGMPDQIKETFSIRVAHFQPQVVTLLGEGVYPSLSLTLPRVRSPEYQQALVEAQESLQRAAAAKPEVVPRYQHKGSPLQCCEDQVHTTLHVFV